MPYRRTSLSEEERLLWELVVRKTRPLLSKREVSSQTFFCDIEKKRLRSNEGKTRIVFFENGQKKERPAAISKSTDFLHVLDLHGFTVQEAFCSFRSFMERAKGKKWKEVEIITGLGVSGRGIIRRELRHWLERKEYSSRITEIFHPSNNLGAVRIKFSVR
ncbi:hypothetical protein FAI40_09730 [Acetobacteraceae bacterium]|nr:hypothetical protein FAI40_09730 [Acetobacteraceae bacterium]